MRNICTVDIETPKITKAGVRGIRKIYCIGVKSDDKPTEVFTYIYFPGASNGNLLTALKFINSHKTCVMHNGLKFDKHVIENIVGEITIPIMDTLLLSKLMFTKDELFAIDKGLHLMPSAKAGGYSLEAFGIRFGDYKIAFHDFDKLTTEMITYCKQDVDLTYRLFTHLRSLPNFPKQNVIDLENTVAELIYHQEQNGFYYNYEKAREFMVSLKFKKMSLEHKLKTLFKPKFLADGPEKSTNSVINSKVYRPYKTWKHKCAIPYRFIHPLPRTKAGKYKMPGKLKFKWFTEPNYMYKVQKVGTYQPIKLTRFNPGSRTMIKKWLLKDYKFEFQTYTSKGSKKVDGEQLETLGEKGKDLREYLKITKDLSEVVGVIEAYNEESHSIHGRVDTIGAATHRCTHSSPNVAQTSADPIFRSFYSVPPGYTLVGADLANI